VDWYKRYIGDYRRDTARLSALEHGMYTLLLDEYFALEQPLPSDPRELDQLCRAKTKADREAVRKVAKLFFPINGADGQRHNKRADEEIEKYQKSNAGHTSAGRRGAQARWSKKKDSQANGPANSPANGPANGPAYGKANSPGDGKSMAFQNPESRLKNSVPSGKVKPGPRHVSELLPSPGNGKHRTPTEEPEEERVRKALVVIAGDPQCTEADAARMFRVSIDAIQAARRET
jgi:uncharacterized protein YdaU (DUF1376 family)